MRSLLFTVWVVTMFTLTAVGYAADNKVVVVPLGSPVKAVGVEASDIISQYVSLTSGEVKTVLTVPNDKGFMLTDVQGNCEVVIKENDTILAMLFLYTIQDSGSGPFARSEQSVSFNSGIPFAPGTAVKLGDFGASHCTLTISGYYY